MMDMNLFEGLEKFDNGELSPKETFELATNQFTDEELNMLLIVAENWIKRFAAQLDYEHLNKFIEGLEITLHELWKLDFELGSREFNLNFDIKHKLTGILHELRSQQLDAAI